MRIAHEHAVGQAHSVTPPQAGGLWMSDEFGGAKGPKSQIGRRVNCKAA